MEASLANLIAVRGTVFITSPLHRQTKPLRGGLADLCLHHSPSAKLHHAPSARPIQTHHWHRLQNHSSIIIATSTWTANPQQPRLNHSSTASKAFGRGGSRSKALGRGDQPAQSGQQKTKSGPDKASASPPDRNVTDSVSENQFWRQQINRSLGELSSSSGGGVANGEYGREIRDQLDVGQSSGDAEEVAAAPKATRATGSHPPSSYSPDPSSAPSPSGVTPTQSTVSAEGSPALTESKTPAQVPGNSQNLASKVRDAETAADIPDQTSQTQQPARPLLNSKINNEAALSSPSAQTKAPPSEAATPSAKAPFKRRETDVKLATKPGGGVPRGPRPQVVEPLSTEDWENMSHLLGMPVKELERNSAGNGLAFEAAAAQGPGLAGEREAEANVQQEKKLPRGPGTAPPGGRRPHVQESRRPAPVAVLSRETVASVPSTNLEKVDRSELTKLRQSLNQKLSEANMYNRHLQREISARDVAVNESTLFLGALQTELKTLVEIAKEIAAGGTRPVTRKINGRYIQSHLAARLEDLHSQLAGQLQQVDVVRLRDVPVTWLGVAEDVKLMGSFDGWTRGQHLSPETTGTFTLFSSVLQLRPGRYEVKFVVDGNWQLAPSWPVVGEGLSANNLLVVD